MCRSLRRLIFRLAPLSPFCLQPILLGLWLNDHRSRCLFTLFLTQTSRQRDRYYRVEVAYNLFGEYSVMREWGPKGRQGRHLLVWFSNLRDACLAAERWHRRAMRRGYSTEGFRR